MVMRHSSAVTATISAATATSSISGTFTATTTTATTSSSTGARASSSVVAASTATTTSLARASSRTASGATSTATVVAAVVPPIPIISAIVTTIIPIITAGRSSAVLLGPCSGGRLFCAHSALLITILIAGRRRLLSIVLPSILLDNTSLLAHVFQRSVGSVEELRKRCHNVGTAHPLGRSTLARYLLENRLRILEMRGVSAHELENLVKLFPLLATRLVNRCQRAAVQLLTGEVRLQALLGHLLCRLHCIAVLGSCLFTIVAKDLLALDPVSHSLLEDPHWTDQALLEIRATCTSLWAWAAAFGRLIISSWRHTSCGHRACAAQQCAGV